MRKIFKLFCISFTCVLAIFLVPNASLADEPAVNLTISPSLQYISVAKGESQKKDITVLNKGDKPLALRVYAENFEAADMFGGLKFNSETQPEYSSKTWLNFDKTNLLLLPEQSEKVNIDIQVPKVAESGGHYSVIFFEPILAQETTESSSLGVSQRIGALMFITVGGNIREEGLVLGASSSDKCSGVQCSFKTAPFREWGPVPFTFQYENIGNTHVWVSGNIAIFNLFGQKVGEIPIEEKTVLPKSKREFSAKWLREPLLGRYTAKLTLTYGTQSAIVRAETSFWAFPWRLVLTTIVVLGIIGLFVFLFRDKRKVLNNIIVQLSIKKDKYL